MSLLPRQYLQRATITLPILCEACPRRADVHYVSRRSRQPQGWENIVTCCISRNRRKGGHAVGGEIAADAAPARLRRPRFVSPSACGTPEWRDYLTNVELDSKLDKQGTRVQVTISPSVFERLKADASDFGSSFLPAGQAVRRAARPARLYLLELAVSRCLRTSRADRHR